MDEKKEFIPFFILLASFFIGWYSIFGKAVFLNPAHSMYQGPTISQIDPIGADLWQLLSYAKELREGRSPYIGANLYPPLTSIIFSSLVYLDKNIVYEWISILTLLSLFISLFIVVKLISKNSYIPVLLIFIGITSIYSYGLHFELERGQFNIIAITCALYGLWLFKKEKLILGLLFLTLGIQLKIYPVMFLVLLILDNIRNRRKLFILLGTVFVNCFLLFVLGKQVFHEFKFQLLHQIQYPFIWVGNHSLFAYCHGESPIQFCNKILYPYFLGGYFIILFTAIILCVREKTSILNSYVFALSGFGILLIPSVSNDYTLSMLPLFMLPLLTELYQKSRDERSIGNYIFLSLLVVLYTFSLFSNNYSPVTFMHTANKAPVLIALIITTFIAFILNTFTVNIRYVVGQKQRKNS